MEEIQNQRNIFINDILLINKHMCLSRNYQSLNFIGLKDYILETKLLQEKITQNNPHKKCNFSLKNGRLSAMHYFL